MNTTLNLDIESGASAYADGAEALTDALFGARYISYRGVNRFLDHIEDIDIGLIVWPGGTLAETRPDRYGFEFDGLQNPANNKPDLTEMMAIAVDKGADLSVILPTFFYVDDVGAARAEISGFLQDLLAGDFGPLPDRLILEVGSEYYAHFSDGATSAAAQYGAVADVMVTEIADALADPSINLIGADITIAVQSGRTLDDDTDLRGVLSEYAIDSADMLIHHRFAFQPQGIDGRIAQYQDVLDAWEAETGTEPDLFVSAWNTVTLTRNGVLADFIEYQTTQGVTIDASDVDLDGRTTVAFENYWQDALDQAAYGQEHAAYILESFASYAEAGADAASLYGVDLIHPGRVSWRENGADYDFVGLDMLDMIYESVGGTHVLSSDGAYDTDALATTYGFENDDKLVLFIAAGDTSPGDIALQLDGFGDVYTQVWAERLTSAVPSDWMAVFGVPDTAGVDESPEGDTFAIGMRDAVTPVFDGETLAVSLTSPHEVIRLSFAKTAAGAHEIAGWSDGRATDLSGDFGVPVIPECGIMKDGILCQHGFDKDADDADQDDGFAVMAEAIGAGAGVSVLWLVLFFL